jgi:hypothetical protein
MAQKTYQAPQGAFIDGIYYAPGELVTCDEKKKSRTFIEMQPAAPQPELVPVVPAPEPVVQPTAEAPLFPRKK